MRRLAIIFIIFIATLLLILIVKLNVSKGTSANIVNLAQTEESGLGTIGNSEGSVSVVATPLSLKNNSSVWDFKISLDTHSEELSFDLVAVSEMLDDQGKSYKPISWEGTPAGGHHREGTLKFNPILPKPKSIELKIKSVGGILERRFKWDL